MKRIIRGFSVFLAACISYFALAVGVVGATPVLNRDNGHYYEYTTFSVGNWEDAKNYAENAVYSPAPGVNLKGYLVQINSADEQAFLESQYTPHTAIIDGSDREIEGVFKYMTGPEKGKIWWNNGPVPGKYSSWATGEPNDSGSGEDYVSWSSWGRYGWNDVSGGGAPFIEYGAHPQPPFYDPSNNGVQAYAGSSGYGRIGSTVTVDVITANTLGTALGWALFGAFEPLANTRVFSGAGSVEFGPLGVGQRAARGYEYHPDDRVQDIATVSVTSFMGSIQVDLKGTGVGPDFKSSIDPGGTIDFGLAEFGSDVDALFTIFNCSPDSDTDLSLTGLSLLSAEITGPDASFFSLQGFTPSSVVQKDGRLDLTVSYHATEKNKQHQAQLKVTTDQNSEFGTSGKVFTYDLTSQVIPDFYLRDPVTGLIWLDLSETVGLSVDEVVGRIGNDWYEDFRYATRAEVLELWDNFGLQPGDVTDSQDSQLWQDMETFFDGFGRTKRYTRTDLLNGIIDPLAGSPLLADTSSMSMYWDVHYPDGWAEVYPVQQDIQAFDWPNPTGSHYLVMRTDVPEPPMRLLMLVGLSGMIVIRKNNRGQTTVL